MARLVAAITTEFDGLDRCVASMGAIAESADNAHVDLDDLGCDEGVVSFGGMKITTMSMHMADWTMTVHIKPAPAMILFIGWLMSKLPSYATVTWRDGWPHVYCPPRDDRDHEDDPTPLVPNELVPA